MFSTAAQHQLPQIGVGEAHRIDVAQLPVDPQRALQVLQDQTREVAGIDQVGPARVAPSAPAEKRAAER